MAGNPEQYVNTAQLLAGDRELLLLLRQNLRSIMQASPLMNGRAYMKDLEQLYRLIYRKNKMIIQQE